MYTFDIQVGAAGFQRLVGYDWRGNVQELESMLQRLVVTTALVEVRYPGIV